MQITLEKTFNSISFTGDLLYSMCSEIMTKFYTLIFSMTNFLNFFTFNVVLVDTVVGCFLFVTFINLHF